jgi:hypothetical protein
MDHGMVTFLEKKSEKNQKQKRMVLWNLSEDHQNFNEQNPDHSFGFSKFCYFRPEECVLAGPKSTH